MDNVESLEDMWKREAAAASLDAVGTVSDESEEVRSERVRIWKGLALPSLALGLLSSLLVYGNPSSVTMLPFIIAVVIFCRHVMRLAGISVKRGSVFCLAVMLLLALSDCLTDNAFIIFSNNLGICLVLAVGLLHNFCDDSRWQLGTYFARMLRCAGGTIESLGDAVSDLLAWKKATGKGSKTALSVLAGAAISAPLLALVISLLCSADERYAAQLGWLFGHVQAAPAARVCLFTLAAILASYYTSRFLVKRNLPSEVKEKRQFPAAVALTMLTLFCLVYVSFVCSQFVPPPEGTVSYAGTAREGFFQLLAVSIINVIIVQAVLARFGDCIPLKVLLSVFCACTYVMIASAALRMFRYIGHYGQLTFLRVLVLWTLAVLALLLAGQVVQVFLRRFPLFRYGFAAVCVCYVELSLARPDYWIASYNLSRLEQDETKLSFRDITELEMLARKTSCDAAPAFARSGRLSAKGGGREFFYRDTVMEKLEDRPLSLRTWNFSRARARELLQE